MGNPCNDIKSYPELNLEVMRRRMEPQYRVWLLARYLDRIGGGYVRTKVLRRFVIEHGLFTRKTLYRALEGPSPLWRRSYSLLYLTSVRHVAAYLEVELRSEPVLLPLTAFESMHALRSAFVASFMAGKPKTIAIATLCRLTGRTRRVVRDYLNSQHITKTPNAMVSARSPSPHLDPGLAAKGYFHTRRHGKYLLVKRMPNTYESDLETAPRGITRKKLRKPSYPTVSPPPAVEDPAGCSGEDLRDPLGGAPHRCYYREPKAASRALQALSPRETIYTLSEGETDALGFQLWRGYTVLEPGGGVESW